jgi:hypothetical protein
MYMFSTVLYSREPIGQKYRSAGNYSAQQRNNLLSGTIRGNLETLAPKWSHALVYAWLWLQDKTPWTVKRSIGGLNEVF